MLTIAAILIAIGAIWYASQVQSSYYHDMKAKDDKIIMLQVYIKDLKEAAKND